MSARDSRHDPFASRRPPAPQVAGGARELLWQCLAIVALALGADYIRWRWMQSLNPDALWFALPLAAAETAAFVGFALQVFAWWATRDPERQEPPRTVADCGGAGEGPIRVDVIVSVHDEAPDRLRLVLRAARRLTYPHPLVLRVHVVDHGRREDVERAAAQEGAQYVPAEGAPDPLHGMAAHGDGEFVVACDGATILLPRLLEHTLGYFRDPRVACVQTPRWFEDLPAGLPLPQWLGRRAGAFGRWFGDGVQELVGTVRIGQDPFACDPQPFFDIALRRRNRFGAIAWCGPGAVLRRSALHEAHVGRSLLHPAVQSASLAPAGFGAALGLRWRDAAASVSSALRRDRKAGWTRRWLSFATAWNACACVWDLLFLLAPIVYFVTGIAPLAGYTSAFYLHAVPFLLALQLALLATTWGVRAGPVRAFEVALAPQYCEVLWHALRGRAPARLLADAREPRGLRPVAAQVTLLALTVAGLLLAGWRVFVQGAGQELPALIVNGAWAVFNLVALAAPVRAALWRPATTTPAIEAQAVA